jgi:hypothetical protein
VNQINQKVDIKEMIVIYVDILTYLIWGLGVANRMSVITWKRSMKSIKVSNVPDGNSGTNSF